MALSLSINQVIDNEKFNMGTLPRNWYVGRRKMWDEWLASIYRTIVPVYGTAEAKRTEWCEIF